MSTGKRGRKEEVRLLACNSHASECKIDFTEKSVRRREYVPEEDLEPWCIVSERSFISSETCPWAAMRIW